MSKQQILRALLIRPIAFHPILARLAGRATAGLLLSQLLYWCERASNEDGWVYKSADEWEKETTLSEDEQRGARKLLENLGIIEIAYAWKHFAYFSKFDKTFCYRINFDRLFECLEHDIGSRTSAVAEHLKFPLRENEITASMSRKSHVDRPKSPVHTTENTSKTTTTIDSEVDELLKAARWAAEQAGTKIRNTSSWEYKTRKRLVDDGVTKIDLSTLNDFRLATERVVQAAKRHNSATKSMPLLMDSSTHDRGVEILMRIDQKRRTKGGIR